MKHMLGFFFLSLSLPLQSNQYSLAAVCSELPKAKRWLEHASAIHPLLQARMTDASVLPGVLDLIGLAGL